MGILGYTFLIILFLISIHELNARSSTDPKIQKTKVLKHHLQNFVKKVKETLHYMSTLRIHKRICLSPLPEINMTVGERLNLLNRFHHDVILLKKLFNFTSVNRANFSRLRRFVMADLSLANLVLKSIPARSKNTLNWKKLDVTKVHCGNINKVLFHVIKKLYRRLQKSSEDLLHKRFAEQRRMQLEWVNTLFKEELRWKNDPIFYHC